MRQTILALACAIPFVVPAQTSNRLVEEEMPSRALGGKRMVRVYLPASYSQNATRRYPVLYIHDGQNAYTSAGTNVAFGWGNWELDRTADALSAAGKMREVILVAIDNSGMGRYGEYNATHTAAGATNRTPYENYSAFLIEELKPKIDQTYRTESGTKSTGVLGSSMGGICSAALGWEHPDVFGRAASLSGAFQVEGTNFLNRVVRPYSGARKPVRLYLDCGTCDFMGGDDGRSLTDELAAELKRLGWGKDLLHVVDEHPRTEAELEKLGLRRDKWKEAQKSQHNEFYWRLRVGQALVFMFPATEGQVKAQLK